ncbi:diacylglycerol kinase [Anaerococcus hydrogenalis]|uniref:Prokaryotic diacylglycerol kinase n=1 Tax=Anaerococcus hydrogenalis ACS-025-V-Sch4 TaxID=879306 RepID=F0H317_9FIRM|nr:diacylglycerol kinase [Anaerococcus hydrogenalis]EGC83163.1 prokaryotic diacylglycerol kinase [Anaerococcus hydrogenalis ACS-025-V-Sch4]
MKDEKQLIEEIKSQVKEELKEEKRKEDEAQKYIPKTRSAGEKFVKGFDYAFEGLVFAINNEKNMKFHVLTSILVLFISLFLNVSRVEMMFLVFSIAFVISCELLNTSLEQAVNLAGEGKKSKEAKASKDLSAAATFVSALNTIFVAYLVFFDKVANFSSSVVLRISRRPSHLALIAVSIVIISTIFFKGIFYKGHGTAFHGGFVSGHTSISFCLATIGAMRVDEGLLIFIFYGLAIIVAESRFEANIHSLPEIIRGAILGTAIALLIFGVFS